MAQGRRRHLAETAIVLVIAAIGIAIFAIGGPSLARDVIGTAIASCAGVLAVSLAFYEVGRGEDEARAAGWHGPYDRAAEDDAHAAGAHGPCGGAGADEPPPAEEHLRRRPADRSARRPPPRRRGHG